MMSLTVQACPRCSVQPDAQNRLITDSCGHVKCRRCFLLDEDSCAECEQSAGAVPAGANDGKCTKDDKATGKRRIKKSTFVMPGHIKQVQTADGTLQFHCNVCVKSFGSRSQRYYHLACGNEAAKKYKCDQCQKCFSSLSHFKYHMESHSKLTYECAKCKKTFANKTVLKKHQKTHELKPVSCDECGKTYRFLESLAAHMHQHRNNLRFQCNICDKKYAVKSTLQQHMLKHQAKKHQCTLCKKRFQRNSTLKSHLKRHSKTERFVCTACNKNFSDAAALMRHGKIHEESVKYKCVHCDITTIRKDNMLRHVRNIHVGEDFESCVETIRPVHTAESATNPNPTAPAISADIKESNQLNLPKTVRNSSVIKCIGNVEPVEIQTTHNEYPDGANGNNTLQMEPAPDAPIQPAVIRHKKLKPKYDPIEMYRRILISDDENEPDEPDEPNDDTFSTNSTSGNNLEVADNELEKPAEQLRTTLNTPSNFSEMHWRKNFKYTYQFQEY